MSELSNLYQEVILDHSRNPRNFCENCEAGHKAEGYNPLCGDQLSLFLKIENNIVEKASFLGSGCAISTASASLMTEAIQGKSVTEVQALFKEFHTLLTQDGEQNIASLGKLESLSGVREFPMRVKCATLAWHTLQSALESPGEITTTE